MIDVIRRADIHHFQLLTKRSERMRELAPRIDWPGNLWMGVSVENMKYAFRIDDLREVPAAIRFLSCEPLLGSLKEASFDGMDWIIAGGESGPRARPMEEKWVREIRAKCRGGKIPFFFKQWGSTNKKRTERVLDDRTWDQFPRCARHLRAG